jgi:phosphohistidine phosphatase
MDLILWRHADAQDGVPDLDRALTAKGRKQAQQIAYWLKVRMSDKTRILASPAVRARQTADALGLGYDVVEAIGPGADAADLLAAAGWPDAGLTTLLIGHQPSLGLVASLLVCGEESEMSIKKGGVVWLSNRVRTGEPQIIVKAVMTPEMV